MLNFFILIIDFFIKNFINRIMNLKLKKLKIKQLNFG